MSCISHELTDLANKTFAVLKATSLHVVTAESCTAGLIAACLSQSENASDLLEGGFVTYTKGQKTRALGVREDLLTKRSAVNGEVAQRMAEGALERSGADIALAVTGVLGPSPDEDGNPVGLVFYCCARRGGEPVVQRREYDPFSHDELRSRVVCDALEFLAQQAASGDH